MKKLNILWIRNDLRINDNVAITRAINYSLEKKQKLLVFFNINVDQYAPHTQSNDYFFSTLKIFYEQLKKLNIPMMFIKGGVEEAFIKLTNKYSVDTVFCNGTERGYGLKRDHEINDFLINRNVNFKRFFDHHLVPVNSIKTDKKNNYNVYTFYLKKWLKKPKPDIFKTDIKSLKKVVFKDFDAKQNYEEVKDVLNNFYFDYLNEVGEIKALETLENFIKNDLKGYIENRDLVFQDRTSNLSAYLSTGAISIRTIYHKINNLTSSETKTRFIEQLCWRDFYNMIYYFYPYSQNHPIIKKYETLPYKNDPEAFKRWKEGKTGFPIVDAAMRKLAATGKIHNRNRMIVSSFLVKDLLIDWRWGEKYFAKALIDYDSASNIGSWQWSASTGVDAVPYFRVFNPTLQSKKVDPNGIFIRKWVPELTNVPDKYIHEPSTMPKELQNEIGLIITKNYPCPIVEHKKAKAKVTNLYSKNWY